MSSTFGHFMLGMIKIYAHNRVLCLGFCKQTNNTHDSIVTVVILVHDECR